MNRVENPVETFSRFSMGILVRIPVGYGYEKRGRPKPTPFGYIKTTKTFLIFHSLEVREVGDHLLDFRRRVAVVLEYGLDGLRLCPVDLWENLTQINSAIHVYGSEHL